MHTCFHTEPKVWFSSANYTVQEPLSNFPVDRRCAELTLLRGGDTSLSLVISYTTLAGSARPGEHYVPVNGTVHFEPREETRNITVPILASEDSREVSFMVRLVGTNLTTPTENDLQIPPPSVIATEEEERRSEGTVVILNTPLTGVLFPDKPVVMSLLPEGLYPDEVSLYFNAPLVCVDVSMICSAHFETYCSLDHFRTPCIFVQRKNC